MTEQQLRASVVDAAESWVGCKEANGTHKPIIDLYNSHKPLARGYPLQYTDQWCSGFASAAAIKAGLTNIIPTEVGCGEHIKLFQALGAWEENDAYIPKPGDYLFYDWQAEGEGDNVGWADHVGIVTACDGKTITVIEGNKDHAVGYRRVPVDGPTIRGFGVPDYASLADKPQKKDPWWQPYADWVVTNDIANGARGDEPATRGEVWAMLQRMADKIKEGVI